MNSQDLFFRLITSRIREALSDTPVVMIAGPRQAGKTTLVRNLETKDMRYLTLDDKLTLLSAQEDPQGMIRGINRAVIDEVQRAPGLLLAIKKSIDEDRRPGRFLITGSANLMMLPTVADSLAGRMETLTLLPLSQSEIYNNSVNWIDAVFKGNIPKATVPVIGDELIKIVLRGGYPEAIHRTDDRRRNAWHRQYIAALIQRDVREVAEIEKTSLLPRFMRCMAQTAGKMCNYTKLGGATGLDGKTADRYISVLEQMFLVKRLDVWSKNEIKRIAKTPKLQFIDSGLLSSLLGINQANAAQNRSILGFVLETFVYGELMKQMTTADNDYQLLYYRDADKVEVDIVIENSVGELVGLEVKASATVRSDDLRGLKKLSNISGKKFKLGLLLYDGTETSPLGDKIWAAPLSTLWGK